MSGVVVTLNSGGGIKEVCSLDGTMLAITALLFTVSVLAAFSHRDLLAPKQPHQQWQRGGQAIV